MKSKPRASHYPIGRTEANILWTCISPDISIMVCHKTTTTIHLFRCFFTIFSNSFDKLYQRLMAFREIGQHSRPVIHLSVNIYGIFTTPYRCIILAPDSLKIRRQRTWSGAGDEKISSKLEESYYLFLTFNIKSHSVK